MAPRKSKSKTSRPSRSATGQDAAGDTTVDLPDIPGPSIPTSTTPDYVPSGRERVRLDEDEREAFLHDLVCFHPREVCDQFTERVLEVPVLITNSLQRWAEQKYAQRDGDQAQLQREMNMGLVAIETLLESHVDKAMDKFTAWALRNTFEIPSDVEVVLPWQQGLDFERAQHVTDLPKGMETLSEGLEASRTKLEQARLLVQRLIVAEQALDRRLEIAKQRRAEVGFVKEVLASSGLSPLPEKTTQIVSALSSLHETLTPLTDDPYQSQPGAGENTKAWEMGRQAYLNWAAARVLPGQNLAGSRIGKVDSAGRDDTKEVEGMMQRTGHEGLDKLTRSME